MQVDYENVNPVTRAQRFSTWLKKTCLEAFVETYGFEGYNFATKRVTFGRTFDISQNYNEAVDKVTSEHEVKHIDASVLVASFFGVPSRPEAVVDDSGYINATLSADRATWKMLLGFDVSRKITAESPEHPAMAWTEKDRWEALLITLFAIPLLALRTLLIIPKLVINITKLFTEFLPAVLSATLSAAKHQLHRFYQDIIDNGTFFTIGIPFRGKTYPWSPTKTLLEIGLDFSDGLLEASLFVSKLLEDIGRAFSSPEKSARLAFAEVSTTFLNNPHFMRIPGATIIANALGGLSALVSIAISATLWAIALPFAFSAIATTFPAVAQVGAVLAMKFPVIISTIQSAFSALSALTVAAFGPAVTAIAGFIGVQASAVSATLMTVGVLGALTITAGSIVTAVSDSIGNVWARWNSTKGPLSRLCRAGASNADRSAASAPINEFEHLLGNTGTEETVHAASQALQDLVQARGKALGEAEEGTLIASNTAQKVEERSGIPAPGVEPPAPYLSKLGQLVSTSSHPSQNNK